MAVKYKPDSIRAMEDFIAEETEEQYEERIRLIIEDMKKKGKKLPEPGKVRRPVEKK